MLDSGKAFEYIALQHDPMYGQLVHAIELVKDFIVEHKLIIYGGTAIDFALRLFGDKIYPDDMLSVPDLDFYSPENVHHAYMLADILFDNGYTDARAINALHMETMRVDVADNHFIADISYRPKIVFDKIPFIEYNGMRIIHPTIQRIDIHSSLAYPYDNSPREVIFERWAKDIKRFNKLHQYYPITHGPVLKTNESTTDIVKYPFTGFAAYSIFYKSLSELIRGSSETMPDNIIPAICEFTTGQLKFSTIDNVCEIVHFNLGKVMTDTCKYYEPYDGIVPARGECTADGKKIIIYSTKNRLVTYNTYNQLRVTNIQYVMRHMLSMYFMHIDKSELASTYLAYYNSLLAMINLAEKIGSGIYMSLFLPSVSSYGSENTSMSREIALNKVYHVLDGVPQYMAPMNYYPARSKSRGVGHPSFDPTQIIFFRSEGREISEENLADAGIVLQR